MKNKKNNFKWKNKNQEIERSGEPKPIKLK